MNDDSMLDDDLNRLLQVMADPCCGGKLMPRERRAITQALNEIHGWREKNWNVARDTVSPGPDVARLLASAKSERGIDIAFEQTCWHCQGRGYQWPMDDEPDESERIQCGVCRGHDVIPTGLGCQVLELIGHNPRGMADVRPGCTKPVEPPAVSRLVEAVRMADEWFTHRAEGDIGHLRDVLRVAIAEDEAAKQGR